jgi:hypothetical protein
MLEPGLERREDRHIAPLAPLAALLGGLAANVGLDGVEAGDAGQRLAGDRRGGVGGLQLVEVPPHVRLMWCST